MKAIKQLLPYLKGKWNYVLVYTISNLLSVIFSTITVFTINPFLKAIFGKGELVTKNPGFHLENNGLEKYFNFIMSDYIASHNNNKEYGLIFICIVAIFSTFFKNVFLYVSKYILNPMRNSVVYKIRKDIYEKTIQLPIGFFTNERKGDILSRMTNDVNAIETSMSSLMELLFSTPITVVFYFVVLSFISLKLFAFLLVLLPIAGLIIGKVSKSLKKYTLDNQTVLGNILSILEETLSGLRIVKAFGAEQNRMQVFEAQNKNIVAINNKIASRRELASPLSEFMGISILSSIIWFGGKMALQNPPEIEPGLFIVFIAMFYFLINPLKSLSGIFYNLHQGSSSLERINLILQAENKIINKENAQDLQSFEKNIELKNVSFSYADRIILKNINLTIEKGKTVALVGSSGAGKSTLVDLIPRFHDVSEGEILIDGKNIQDYKIEDVRKLMGIVSQEPILFNDTIEKNIALGSSAIDAQKIQQAAEIANVNNIIAQKENGLQEMIGDRGVKLSGGEKQRLTIARAIYKNPPILILDEATSSLDTISEKQVQEAINELMKNRTTIVIAHRLSTVQNADEIIVLDKGEIKERGTHAQLIAQHGMYKNLVEMQQVLQ